jgi:hypothetical protein
VAKVTDPVCGDAAFLPSHWTRAADLDRGIGSQDSGAAAQDQTVGHSYPRHAPLKSRTPPGGVARSVSLLKARGTRSTGHCAATTGRASSPLMESVVPPLPKFDLRFHGPIIAWLVILVGFAVTMFLTWPHTGQLVQ